MYQSRKKKNTKSGANATIIMKIIRRLGLVVRNVNFPFKRSPIMRKNSTTIPQIVSQKAMQTATSVPKCSKMEKQPRRLAGLAGKMLIQR